MQRGQAERLQESARRKTMTRMVERRLGVAVMRMVAEVLGKGGRRRGRKGLNRERLLCGWRTHDIPRLFLRGKWRWFDGRMGALWDGFIDKSGGFFGVALVIDFGGHM